MLENVVESVSRHLSEGGVLSGVPAMHDPVARFFMQAVFIITICRGLTVFTYFLKQPVVVFEIIGGILLGPSAFGRDGYYLMKMFPSESLGNLSLVANIGLVLYLFLVGLELDPELLKTHFRKAGTISLFGMVVPFCLGIAVSRVMFDTLQGNDPDYKDVSFTSFFVFMGTAMSITAFPVLARILKEGGLIYTRPGALAMGAAAIDDATAWCLLILAISIANAKNMNIAGLVFLCVISYGIGLYFIIKPMLDIIVKFVEAQHIPLLDGHLFAFIICLVFLSAWTTYLLGVHFIFGAFIFGLIVPRDSKIFHECIEKMESFVLCITLPLYFALSGLKTDVTTISSGEEGAMVILVCFVACAGKMCGAGFAAYFNGISVRESSVIAVLMNTRGLVELIVLNLGKDAGILSIRTFSVMVIMALFTTFLTCPLIELIYPPYMRVRAGDEDKHTYALTQTGEDGTENPDHDVNNDLTKQSKLVRLGVVVDCIEHMQSVINIIGYFVPHSVGSSLTVTAMHFIEPTLSIKDEFLGLNDEGQLIRVDEETTDIAQAVQDLMAHSNTKKPELLPISMFCKGVGASVNAFRIQGDPEVFPLELRQITKHNDCSVVLVPWRPHSEYLTKLFWQTTNNADMPIALVVCKADHTVAAPHTNTLADLSVMANTSTKPRSNSVYTATFNVKATNKVNSNSKNSSDIVAVITGNNNDVIVLSLIQRFVLNLNYNIVVYFPSDYELFSEVLVSAINTFTNAVGKFNNLKIVYLVADSQNNEAIFKEIYNPAADLYLCSFVEPYAPVVAAPAGRAKRSQSITAAFSEAIMPVPAANNVHMPEKYVGLDVPYLELGALGRLLYEDSTSTNENMQILILHESNRMAHHAARRPSQVVSTPSADGTDSPRPPPQQQQQQQQQVSSEGDSSDVNSGSSAARGAKVVTFDGVEQSKV